MDYAFKLIFSLFLLFFSTFSYALGPSTSFKPTSINSIISRGSFGAVVDVVFEASVGGRNKVYGKRPVTLSKAIIGGALKSRAFTPWGLGLSVAVAAAGYILDDSTGTVYLEPVGDIALTGFCGFNRSFTGSLSSCIAVRPNHSSGTSYSCSAVGMNTCTDILAPNGANVSFFASNGVPATAPVSVSNDSFFDIVSDSISDDELIDVLTDPETQHPYSVLDPIESMAQEMTDDFRVATQPKTVSTKTTTDTQVNTQVGLDPAASPETSVDTVTDSQFSTDPTTGIETETATTTETTTVTDPVNDTETVTTKTTTIDTDTPVAPDGFSPKEDETDICQKYPTALGCQRLGKMSKTPPISSLDVEFEYDVVFLTSSASCPSPNVFTVSGRSMSFNNSAICDFAMGINPIVILICSVIGIYIVSGGVRNG